MDSTYSSRGTAVTAVSSTLFSITILTTILRLAVRKMNRHLGWDDYIIAAFAVLTILVWPFLIIMTHNGFGRRSTDLAPPQIQHILKYSLVTQAFLYWLLTLPKCSIALFTLRIKDTPWLRASVLALAASVAASNLACFVILLAQCRPTSAYWTGASACWPDAVYNRAIWVAVGFSMFSDVAFTVLPLVILSPVQMPRRLKLAVSGLMSFGLVATVAAAFRAYESNALQTAGDLPYHLALVTIWAVIELSLSAIGANFALSRYIWHFFRDGSVKQQRRSRQTVPVEDKGAEHPWFRRPRVKNSLDELEVGVSSSKQDRESAGMGTVVLSETSARGE